MKMTEENIKKSGVDATSSDMKAKRGVEIEDYDFDLIESDLKKWPICHLADQRKAFIEEVNQLTVNNLLRYSDEGVQELIAKTIYLEKIRMKKSTWKVDPPNEKLFWNRIEDKLTQIKGMPQEVAREKSRELLYRVINRYTEEIVGDFKTNTFKFARKALTAFFKVLFNKFWEKYPFWGPKSRLLDKVKVTGFVPLVRKLMKKGTVVLVPTHSSNLDSIYLGYAIDFKAGLPFFCYGAGLNLYNSEFAAFYMNRMGAYRLDRRKKNAIYLETLKTMSKRMTEMGVNNLFFPGGTRSRSGKIESKLKLGLLGTMIEAQRSLIQNNSNKKVFVVPVITSYPFVLEARVLIDEYLRSEGKEKYFKRKFKQVKRFSKLTFFNHLFTKNQTTWVSFGRPLDVLGNIINEKGESVDERGRVVDVKDYFTVGTLIKTNNQRESIYTKVLADSIVESYKADNVVLPCHFSAFVAFKFLAKINDDKDIFDLFLLEERDTGLKWRPLVTYAEDMHEKFLELCAEKKLKLTPAFNADTETLLLNGIEELGHYSVRKPLKYLAKSRKLCSEDVKLLFFYHNRLQVYERDLYPDRETSESEL
nr:1-acyl-sn-glycerol-3-phosphate acyltransferase [Saprospiraceae bacterium]